MALCGVPGGIAPPAPTVRAARFTDFHRNLFMTDPIVHPVEPHERGAV